MLAGDGIGCYDLDGCVTEGQPNEAASAFIANLDAFYIELSPSGSGLHAWVEAEPTKGWRKNIDGLKVEFYTQERFMTVTGRALS